MNRRIVFTLLVIITAVCLVLSVVSVLAAGIIIWKPELFSIESVSGESTPTQLPLSKPDDPGIENSDKPEPTSLVEMQENDQEPIPPQILVEMELIQRQVIQDRGLEATGIFTRVLYTRDQLSQRVLNDFLEDYSAEEAREDAIVLEAFGLLNSDFDMYKFYLELLSEQVAGFYDNETKEMVIVQDTAFGGSERLTYAHEYTHALQDQNFDFHNGLLYYDEVCEDDSERCAAIQVLLEGDATLSELNWFQNHATSEDQSDILSFLDSYESPVFDSSPDFIAQDFLFPYEFGYEFVNTIYNRGGWDAVDKVYKNLPVSTEQILHPERYPDDRPKIITLPDISASLGDGWDLIDQGEMGEWYTYLILAHGLDPDSRLKDNTASNAAGGWGGDKYYVFYHPDKDKTIMVLRMVWDTPSDAKEFTDAFTTYAQDRFGRPVEEKSDFKSWNGNSEIHHLHFNGAYTTWIFAPDESIADSIWEAILNE
jgi:hypothetical protein